MRSGVVTVLFALVLCAQSATAAPARPLDGADIAGVRIGMTLHEARAALAKRFPEGTFNYRPTRCVAEYVALLRSRFSNEQPGHCFGSMTLFDDLISVEVSLIEDFPAHPGVMRVFGVRYEQDDLLSHGGVEERAFEAAAVARYGPPTKTVEGVRMWGELQPIDDPPTLPTTGDDGTLRARVVHPPSAPFLIVRIEPASERFSSGIVGMFDLAFAAPRDAAIRSAFAAVTIPARPPKF